MPDIPQRLHQAVAWFQAGNIDQAEAELQAVSREAPERADVWGLLGLAAHHRGQLQQAVLYLQRAIERDPNTAAHHSNLGIVYASLGDRGREEACYRQALQCQPNDPASLGNLGLLLCDMFRWREGLDTLRQALTLKPQEASWLVRAGEACWELGQPHEARAMFERSLALEANQPAAHNGLGLIALAAGDGVAAEQCFRAAIRLLPNYAAAHNNLGNVLAQRGEWLAAVGAYRAALAAMPNYAEAHANLGNVLGELGQLDQAVAEYRRAIQINPSDPLAYANLAETLVELGELDEADRTFAQCQAVRPSDAIKLRAAIAVPGVSRTSDEIRRIRERVATNLARLETETLRIDNPLEAVGAPLFFAGYHGENERPTRRRLAEILRRACPATNYVAPHCEPGVGQASASVASGRPRVGLISRFFHQHSIARHYGPTIQGLRREGCEVVVIRTPGPDDESAREIQAAADRVVTIPVDVNAAQALIAAERLDVLCYTDIGMDPLTYHLAFRRLAPVQCVLPGHPVTTGISTIDYFISCDDFESADAQAAYTERLVRFRSLPTSHIRPELPAVRKTRGDLGWSADAHVYLCAQPLFKLHPDFDQTLAAVLRADPAGRLVLFRDHRERWNRLVEQRLRQSLGDVFGRVTFSPRLLPQDFWQALSLADVALDTPHFNGGTTTTQTLGLGTPLVTLPGQYLCNRVTAGCMRKLGVLDTVASSTDDYVARAVQIAGDRAYRDALAEKIRQRSRVMFEENDFVRELAAFFKQVVGS